MGMFDNLAKKVRKDIRIAQSIGYFRNNKKELEYIEKQQRRINQLVEVTGLTAEEIVAARDYSRKPFDILWQREIEMPGYIEKILKNGR